MRWPFTTYGTTTLLAFSGLLLGLAGILLSLAGGLWWLIPMALLVFVLAFFRDPERRGPGGEETLLAPADGLVADVLTVDDPDLGPDCTRIGIFLSVFNVHVNRVPCTGEVVGVERREGGFLDARDPRASAENQAAAIVLRRPDGRRLLVRQITGLVARRIVCPVTVGQRFERGQRYGMIRFGSRTELVLPSDAVAAVTVRVGQTVRGGETPVARLAAAAAPAPPAPAVEDARP